MHAALLPLMVVTCVLLDLLDVDVKEGLFAGAKTILPRGVMRDLMLLEAHRLFVHLCQWQVPPGGAKI